MSPQISIMITKAIIFLTANISLALAAAPPNDHFESPQLLNPSGSASITGTLEDATAQQNEPDLSASSDWEDPLTNTNTKTVWYTWTAPAGTSWAQVKTSGINIDTWLSVYTGNTLTSLTRIARNDRWVFEPNRMTFPVTPGVVYKIRLASDEDAYINYGLDYDTEKVELFTLSIKPVPISPVTAEDFVIRGRGRYQLGTPASTIQARDDFAAAVNVDPSHNEARFMLGLSQMLALEGETGFIQLLGNLGIPIETHMGEQSYTIPEDIDGYPDFADGANSAAVLEYLRNTVLPRLSAIDAALTGITDVHFRTAVERSETGGQDYIVDRGDALVLKSMAHSLAILIHFFTTYDLSVPLNDLSDLEREGELDAEHLFSTYTSLLKFSTSDQRPQLANALKTLDADFKAAETFIEDSREITGYYDEFSEEFYSDEATTYYTAEFANYENSPNLSGRISEAATAIDGPNEIGGEIVDLSKLLTTTDSLRDWLPPFEKSDINGQLPKPTLSGILPLNNPQKTNDKLYDLGILYGMSQYTGTVASYLEHLGMANRPGDDPDHDGQDNFKEYLFGLDPASADVVHQAVFPSFDGPDGPEVRFSFVRGINLEDWRLAVLVSDDLEIWVSTEQTVEQVGLAVPNGDRVSETVTYRLIPTSSLPTHKFFRVEARPTE